MSHAAMSARTLALALLIGGFAVGSAHAVAAADTTMTQAAPAAAMKSTMAPATPEVASDEKAGMPKRIADRVEERIKTLHDKLKITATQEDNWNAVATAMRDNESQISELIKARHKDAKSMNAVQDLQSYQKIAQAHADGLSKLIGAFDTLYSGMSADQKKNADDVFGHYEGHRGGHRHKKPAAKTTP